MEIDACGLIKLEMRRTEGKIEPRLGSKSFRDSEVSLDQVLIRITVNPNMVSTCAELRFTELVHGCQVFKKVGRT